MITSTLLIASGVLVDTIALSADAPPTTTPSPDNSSELIKGTAITPRFKDADVAEIVLLLSFLAPNKPRPIVDRRARGFLTTNCTTPISVRAFNEMMNSVFGAYGLRLSARDNQLILEPTGEPRVSLDPQGPTTIDMAVRNSEVQCISIKGIDTDLLKSTIRPRLSANGKMIELREAPLLLVIDYIDNIRAINTPPEVKVRNGSDVP